MNTILFGYSSNKFVGLGIETCVGEESLLDTFHVSYNAGLEVCMTAGFGRHLLDIWPGSR